MFMVAGKILSGVLTYLPKFFGSDLEAIALCDCAGHSSEMNTIAIVLHGNGPTDLQTRLTREVVKWVNENDEEEYSLFYFSVDEFELVVADISQIATIWKNGQALVDVGESEEETEDDFMDFSNYDDTYIVDDVPFYDEDVVF